MALRPEPRRGGATSRPGHDDGQADDPCGRRLVGRPRRSRSRSCPSTPRGRSRRSCCSRSRPTPSCTACMAHLSPRGRRARRRAGAGPSCGPPGLLILFVALISPLDTPWRAVRDVPHGPASADRRRRGDRAHAGAYEVDPQARAPGTDPPDREERPARSGIPPFGVIAYVGVMWLWHVPALYDAALENPDHPYRRAPLVCRGRPSCTGGTCSLPSAHGFRLAGMGPILYIGLDQDPRGPARRAARLLARGPLRVLRRRTRSGA